MVAHLCTRLNAKGPGGTEAKTEKQQRHAPIGGIEPDERTHDHKTQSNQGRGTCAYQKGWTEQGGKRSASIQKHQQEVDTSPQDDEREAMTPYLNHVCPFFLFPVTSREIFPATLCTTEVSFSAVPVPLWITSHCSPTAEAEMLDSLCPAIHKQVYPSWYGG